MARRADDVMCEVWGADNDAGLPTVFLRVQMGDRVIVHLEIPPDVAIGMGSKMIASAYGCRSGVPVGSGLRESGAPGGEAGHEA